MRSIKESCLNRMIFFGENSLRNAINEFLTHYHHERNHQGLGNRIPSATDEATFSRVFGGSNWAVMVILARSGDTYARLRFNTGPGGEILLPVSVDYDAAFEGSDHAVWEREYQANIHPEPLAAPNLQINDNDRWLDELDREAGVEFPEHAFDEEVML